MKIFLDDLRLAPEKYDLIFRTGEELIQWVSENPDTTVELLSLDHDLGEGILDGYEMVKQMVELPNKIKRIQFHTDNLIGLRNMFWYIKNAHKHGLLPELKQLRPQKVICIDGEETIASYFNAMN